MATTITTKQHDDKITFTDTPTIDYVPIPIGDLTDCTVSFLLKNADETIALKQEATIEGDGTFSYQPVPTDVETIGKFRQEWELVYPDGKKLTFPNNGYNVVKIIADLG